MGVIDHYLKNIRSYPDFRTNPEATALLISRMRRGDRQAKSELISSTLNYIAQSAQNFCERQHSWQHLEDIVQEGNKRVAARIGYFNPERSSLADFIQFNTRCAFYDYLHKVNVVNFTDYRRQKRREIQQAYKDLSEELKREPTVTELGEYLDMDEEKVLEFGTRSSVPVIELDAMSDPEVGAKVIEISSHSRDQSSRGENPLDHAINAEKWKLAAECLGSQDADLLVAYKTYGVEYFIDLYFRLTGERKSNDSARQYIRRRVAKLEKYMRKKSRPRVAGGDHGFH
jgi:DNA-directed RNA polymerase specialized sigma subunit